MSLRELEHDKAVGLQLLRLLERGTLVHAFLFAGSDAARRKDLGLAFAKAVLCAGEGPDACGACLSCRKFEDGNHEDLIVLARAKDRAFITVDQIEELQERLRFAPYGLHYAVLIEDAQYMNPQAQNKLLKLLEEPPEGVVFALLAESADALLPTVVSRCSCYWLEETDAKARPEILNMARELARLIFEGAPFYRKRGALAPVLDAKEEGRAMGLELLGALEEILLRESLKLAPGSPDLVLVKRAEEAAKDARLALRQNHNTGYTLKQFCLRI